MVRTQWAANLIILQTDGVSDPSVGLFRDPLASRHSDREIRN